VNLKKAGGSELWSVQQLLKVVLKTNKATKKRNKKQTKKNPTHQNN